MRAQYTGVCLKPAAGLPLCTTHSMQIVTIIVVITCPQAASLGTYKLWVFTFLQFNTRLIRMSVLFTGQGHFIVWTTAFLLGRALHLCVDNSCEHENHVWVRVISLSVYI